MMNLSQLSARIVLVLALIIISATASAATGTSSATFTVDISKHRSSTPIEQSAAAATTTTTTKQQHAPLRQNRRLGIEIKEGDLTFDGSLEDLYVQAYEKVAMTTASPVTSAPVTSAPVTQSPVGLDDDTGISCNKMFDSVDAIIYRFAMEYDNGHEQEIVLAALEKDMNDHIASRLLPCALPKTNNPGRRALQEEIGLVAIDSRAPDTIATTAFCASTFENNTCKVVDGQMRIFVGTGEDPAFVHYKVRLEIRDYLLNSIKDIPGLYATTYLSPEIISPAEVSSGVDNGTPRFQATAESSTLSKRSITLFAFAGAAFIGSVGIAVWFRRTHERRSTNSNTPDHDERAARDYIKTEPPNLPQISTSNTASWDEDEPLSPFSKMLPAAYRLDNGEADMSVILELSEQGSLDRHSSILLSEGGYSTDEGESLDVDLSALNFSYSSQAPVLGAKRRKEDQTLIDV